MRSTNSGFPQKGALGSKSLVSGPLPGIGRLTDRSCDGLRQIPGSDPGFSIFVVTAIAVGEHPTEYCLNGTKIVGFAVTHPCAFLLGLIFRLG